MKIIPKHPPHKLDEQLGIKNIAPLKRNEKQCATIIDNHEPSMSKLRRAPKRIPCVKTKKDAVASHHLIRQEKMMPLTIDKSVPVKITDQHGIFSQSLQFPREKHRNDYFRLRNLVVTRTESSPLPPGNMAEKRASYVSDVNDTNGEKTPEPALKQKQVQATNSAPEKMTPFEVAELLKKKYIIKSFSAQERLCVYIKKFGYFKMMKKRQWPLFLLEALNGNPYMKQLTKGTMDAIFTFLVHAPSCQATFDDFDRRRNLINMRNGVISIEDLKLHPHSPDYGFTSFLNVDFSPDAKSPKQFLKMLDHMFDTEEERQLCLESLAYLISNDTTAKKLIFFFGIPNSGKTALSQLLLDIHGPEFVSAVALEHFGGRFELGSIMHKRLNLCPEVEKVTALIARVIKGVTGGDRQALEDKFEDMFFGRLSLKFFLMANPPLLDVPTRLAQDNGFISRFLFVHFKRTIPVAKRYEEFGEVLFHQEGDGIVYLLLVTLQAWYHRGKEFTRCESSEALLDEFAKRCIQTERSFVKDCCADDPEAFTSIMFLYKKYQADCKRRKKRADSYEDFKRAILSIFPTLREDRKRVEKDGNPVAVFVGIRYIGTQSGDCN